MWRAKTKNVYFISPEAPKTIQAYIILADGCYKVDSDTIKTERDILSNIDEI
jgi:hypothetical protein